MPPSNPPTLAAQLAASRAVVEHIGDELELVQNTPSEDVWWLNLCRDMNAAMPVLRAMLARDTGGLDMLHALETVVGTRAYSGHNDIICALRDMQPHHIVLAAAEVLEGESDER